MKKFPETENSVVIRTDFSDQETWERIGSTIRQPSDFFSANVAFIDEREYEGLRKDELRKRIPEDYVHSFIIVVDGPVIKEADHPLLILDLLEEREFRSVPAQIGGIENNLSTANMDFQEFADAADEAGIFRGFSGT